MAGPRRVVSVFAQSAEDHGKFVFLRRAPGERLAGYWTLPGGGVEEGETLVAAAIREAQEEIGVSFVDAPKETGIARRRQFTIDGDSYDLTVHYLSGTFAGIPRNIETTEHDRLVVASFDEAPQPLLPSIEEAFREWLGLEPAVRPEARPRPGL